MHRIVTTLLAATLAATFAACTATGDPTSSVPTSGDRARASAAVSSSSTKTPATSSPTTTPSATVSPSNSSDGTGFEGGAECENPELGYEVEYPADWWANERIDPDDDDPGFTPIVACTYFAPDPVELQPNAGLPSGIAIQFGLAEKEPIVSGEILDEESVRVDGFDAVRRVEQPEPSPGFTPEGSLIYRYVIELEDGTYLVASTDNILQDDAAYEESRRILDAMMEELDVDD